ncbi:MULTISPECIES: hypothetical protein [Burkholderia]|uniref:hypothetical protein n=1 Tax=Burkholderia TaxID=32008 RepID=UPI00158E702C|nr:MULTISPECIES: hypothetical protein [Burkholderia]MBY4866596.1 hypothetical protein [Burkholderia anthina]
MDRVRVPLPASRCPGQHSRRQRPPVLAPDAPHEPPDERRQQRLTFRAEMAPAREALGVDAECFRLPFDERDPVEARDAGILPKPGFRPQVQLAAEHHPATHPHTLFARFVEPQIVDSGPGA